jgi:hypothetical protein
MEINYKVYPSNYRNHLQKLPDSISQLENLTVLDVRGNGFSPMYIEELKALLPGCDVRY